jgi:cell division septal protein FtsQ
VLWFLFGLSAVIGIGFSPLTRVSTVRIVGCPDFLREEAKATVKGLRSVPFARLDQTEIAAKLRTDPDVESALFTANVFGRGVLRIELRKPVARVVASGRVYLDSAGNLFASRQDPGPLPLVSVPTESTRAGAGICGPVEGRAIVGLLTALQRLFPQEACSLAVDPRGVISLTLEHGGVVEFGSTEDLDEKIEVLGKILDVTPGLMRQVRRLNLTAPDRPVVVRG